MNDQSTCEQLRARGRAIANTLARHIEDPTACAPFISPVHGLSGAAQSLGYARYGDAAQALEQALRMYTVHSGREGAVAVQSALETFQQCVESLADMPIVYEVLDDSLQGAAVLKGLYLVLVEDSSVLAYSVERAFLEAGAARVVLCPSIRKARAILADAINRPHAVLVDHYIGLHKGRELVAWIRAQPHLKQTCLISYSAVSRSDIQNELETETFDAYIAKPIAMSELVCQLHRILSEFV